MGIKRKQIELQTAGDGPSQLRLNPDLKRLPAYLFLEEVQGNSIESEANQLIHRVQSGFLKAMVHSVWHTQQDYDRQVQKLNNTT